jgi:hypothetical protein
MAYPSLIAQGLNPLVDLSCRAQYRQLCFWRSAALIGHALGKDWLQRCCCSQRHCFLLQPYPLVPVMRGIALAWARLILFFPIPLPFLSPTLLSPLALSLFPFPLSPSLY